MLLHEIYASINGYSTNWLLIRNTSKDAYHSNSKMNPMITDMYVYRSMSLYIMKFKNIFNTYRYEEK